jgi:hypothetical protein
LLLLGSGGSPLFPRFLGDIAFKGRSWEEKSGERTEKNKHTNMSLLFKLYPNLSTSEMVK